MPRVHRAVPYVFPHNVGAPLILQPVPWLSFFSHWSAVIWGFVLGLMNFGFFCTGNWLQNLLSKALVWWASPGCGVEGAFMIYGLPSFRAG